MNNTCIMGEAYDILEKSQMMTKQVLYYGRFDYRPLSKSDTITKAIVADIKIICITISLRSFCLRMIIYQTAPVQHATDKTSNIQTKYC